MKEFFEYMCNHYSEGCYNDAQVFSPFNDEMPEGLEMCIRDRYRCTCIFYLMIFVLLLCVKIFLANLF